MPARLSYVLTIPPHRDEAALTPLVVFLHSLEERGLIGAPILLCGASMEGIGAWSMGMAYPELFTAGALMAGAVYAPPIRPRYARLRGIPVWAYHARGDRSIPFDKAYASMAKLLAAGGEGELFAVDSDERYVHERVFTEGLPFERFLAFVQARAGSGNVP